MLNNIKKFEEIILNNKNFIIVSHKNPDGDSTGSSLALYHLLININKNAHIIFPDDLPFFLKWMTNSDKIIIYEKEPQKVIEILKNNYIIICLDFNTTKQIIQFESYFNNNKSYKILIDHHPDPEIHFDLILKDEDVSSTSELLFKIIEKTSLKKNTDKNFAEGIFTGILLDTLSFSVNAHRPATYKIVSKLLEYGIDRDFIYNNIFNNNTLSKVQLTGYAIYKKLKVVHNYYTAYIWLTKKEFEMFNYRPGDIEGLVNYPLTLEGIKLSALFYEKDNYVKISLRSRGNIKVNEIIKNHFIGGGHNNAAGGEEYNLNIEETIKKFLKILPQYISNED
ncbi:MAG: DHH family phosphoesterase [Bacteroidales bacterium]|nr:DHH family phosphoesterase [Bacteroidales bacterium]